MDVIKNNSRSAWWKIHYKEPKWVAISKDFRDFTGTQSIRDGVKSGELLRLDTKQSTQQYNSMTKTEYWTHWLIVHKDSHSLNAVKEGD